MPAPPQGSGRRSAKATSKSAAKRTTSKSTRATRTSTSRAAKTTKTTKTTKATKATKKAAKLAKSTKRATTKTTVTKKAPAKTATKPTTKKSGKKTVICELSGFEVTPGKPNLSPKTLERLKQRLLDERERLLRQAHEFAAEAEQLAREREGGDTQFDEESGEGDTVNVERERDLLLSASARQEVEAIEAALARMRRGTYGVCRYAGRRIPLERLEVMPWADVCVDCKARAERRR